MGIFSATLIKVLAMSVSMRTLFHTFYILHKGRCLWKEKIVNAVLINVRGHDVPVVLYYTRLVSRLVTVERED